MKESIKTLARTCGYTACGITGVEDFDGYRQTVRALAARFPESAALYARMERRASPTTLNPWARSIVVCIRRYGKYALPETLTRHVGRNYLCDRRIPVCPDHTMPARMKAGLTALGLRVRTGGVPSREAAIRAGVACLGRNGFVFASGCGSWINVEAWMINAPVEPDPPAAPAPCPEGCHACQSACRTRALSADGTTDMKRCVAYLTYEAPDPIPEPLWSAMGPWVYGCDDCQRACPLNAGQWENREPAPWITEVARQLTPAALATMDQETYERIVHPLFGYIPVTQLARWQANARRALQSVGALG